MLKLSAMENSPAQTFTASQAADAQTALRKALGLPPEHFPLPAFIGMISEEIEQLRKTGKTDEEITAIIEEATWVKIAAQAVTDFYALPEKRGHHSE